MHLLYADESGSSGDNDQKHFVLAGISVFERQAFWLSQKLDEIAERFNPGDPQSVELHGNPMLKRKGIWKKVPLTDRVQAMKDALSLIPASHWSDVRLFACVVDKAGVSPRDPVEVAFEQLVSRFDQFLMRLYKREGNAQRGILIFDNSTYENTLQNLATDFRKIGHSWGSLKNLSEVPLFIDSRASRIIQLADLVAYAIFRKFESGDDQFYRIISASFDKADGIMHGFCTTSR